MEGAVKKLKYEQPFLSADVWQVVLEHTVDPLVVVRVASTCKTLWRRFRSHEVIRWWRDEMCLVERFGYAMVYGFFDLLKNLMTWIPESEKSIYWEAGIGNGDLQNRPDLVEFFLSDNIMSFFKIDKESGLSKFEKAIRLSKKEHKDKKTDFTL